MTAPTTFNLAPNAASPMTERLEWLTDVSTAWNGKETRYALRAYPRRSYSGSFLFYKTEDRALLSVLRGETAALIPLFPHAFRAPQLTPDAGHTTGGQVLVQTPSGFVLSSFPLTPSLVQSALWAAPCAAAYLDDSRTLTHLNDRIAEANLTFSLVDGVQETISASGISFGNYAAFGRAYRLDARADWNAKIEETITEDRLTTDFGHLRAVESKHFKRRFKASFVLTSRTAILAFRRFLHAVQGRAYPIAFLFKPDAANAQDYTFARLASDTVEIEYISRQVARCSLEMIEVQPDSFYEY